jgi:hypothetical protein
VLGSTEVFGNSEKKPVTKINSVSKPIDFEVEPVTAELIEHGKKLGIDLVWDRHTPCDFAADGNGGAAGVCCFRCQMGPCTLGEATGNHGSADQRQTQSLPGVWYGV